MPAAKQGGVRMKHALAIVAAAFLLALVTVGSASADHADVNKKCADIVDGEINYDGTSVRFDMQLARASCSSITYTVHVADISCPATAGACSDTQPVPIGSESAKGDKSDNLEFQVPASSSDGDDRVCVYATSSRGARLLDRAPDAGCQIVESSADPVLGTPFDCLVICDSCADFVAGPIVGAFPGPLGVRLETATATCPAISYSIEVYDTATNDVVAAFSVPGNGSTTLDFVGIIDPEPGQTVSWRARSSDGSHIYDEGESGCVFSASGVVCAFSFH